MTIRLILRLRRQLAEARQKNTRLEGELHSLDGEIADVRAANTQLRQEATVAVERQVAARLATWRSSPFPRWRPSTSSPPNANASWPS